MKNGFIRPIWFTTGSQINDAGYKHLSETEFHLQHAGGGVLAHIQYGGNYIGILKQELESALNESERGALVVGPQEIAAQIAGALPGTVVFALKERAMTLSPELNEVQTMGKLHRIDVDVLQPGAWTEAYALICEKLVDYELDIALIEGKTLHPQLISTQFSQDEMCIVCSPNHPLALQEKVTLRNFEQSEWMLREAGSGSREFFLRAVAPRIEHWQEAFQLNTTEAIINCVSAGLGFGCLSKLAAQTAVNDGRIKILNVPLDMKRRFWLLVHKEKYQSPLLKHFIEFCHQWHKSSDIENNSRKPLD